MTRAGSYTNIPAAETTLVRTGAGVLKCLIVNKAVASSTIVIYDGIDATGTVIATITHPAVLLHSQIALPYNVAFTTGLTIVTDDDDDITVSWSPE